MKKPATGASALMALLAAGAPVDAAKRFAFARRSPLPDISLPGYGHGRRRQRRSKAQAKVRRKMQQESRRNNRVKRWGRRA